MLAVFFAKTRIGRALRAVADDHQAALSVGISLNQIWIIVWWAAGIVALVTGIMWGARSEVSFALEIIALKALAVLILGGFTSIPGAIVGGLIIGIGEKVFEVYWGGLFGGGTEAWFAYVLALLFLLVRPQGLYGEKIIERNINIMFYREAGQFKTNYKADQAMFPIAQDRMGVGVIIMFAFLLPLIASDFVINSLMIPFIIFAIAAMGLNILTGYCGQLSLGTGAFMGVGAYACYKLTSIFPDVNIIIHIMISGFFASIIGCIFGLPSLRIKGLYLAITTLAAQFFLEWCFIRIPWLYNHNESGAIEVPQRTLAGVPITWGHQQRLWLGTISCLCSLSDLLCLWLTLFEGESDGLG